MTERRVQFVDKLKMVVMMARAPYPRLATSRPRSWGKVVPHLKIVHNIYQVVVRIIIHVADKQSTAYEKS